MPGEPESKRPELLELLGTAGEVKKFACSAHSKSVLLQSPSFNVASDSEKVLHERRGDAGCSGGTALRPLKTSQGAVRGRQASGVFRRPFDASCDYPKACAMAERHIVLRFVRLLGSSRELPGGFLIRPWWVENY